MNKSIPQSNIEWKKWGEIDPLWAVATLDEKDAGGRSPWNDVDFYNLGKLDWEDFIQHWEKYGVDTSSCLEIGCGAGRLTKHISKRFQQTVAIDVSEGMLEYAQAHIKDASVSFQLVDGINIPLTKNSTTAVFSAHVFQHFDSLTHASAYFSEIARVLTPGGSMMIHLPIYEWPMMPKLANKFFQLRKSLSQLNAWTRRPFIKRGWAKPIMRVLNYPISYFYETLPGFGLTDIELVTFVVGERKGLHSFVFSRKERARELAPSNETL